MSSIREFGLLRNGYVFWKAYDLEKIKVMGKINTGAIR
jgi:hypothetical protein